MPTFKIEAFSEGDTYFRQRGNWFVRFYEDDGLTPFVPGQGTAKAEPSWDKNRGKATIAETARQYGAWPYWFSYPITLTYQLRRFWPENYHALLPVLLVARDYLIDEGLIQENFNEQAGRPDALDRIAATIDG